MLSGQWRKFLPANLLEVSARRRADRVAARSAARTLTFGEVNARANRLAHALRELGVRERDRVAFLLPNCVEYYEGYYGSARAGAAHVPILYRLTAPEVVHQLVDSGATALVVAAERAQELLEHRAELADRLPPSRWLVLGDDRPDGTSAYEDALAAQSDAHPAVRVEEDWPAWVRYTSGTTGKPKGSVNTHRGWYTLGQTMNAAWGIGEDDVLLANGPVSHTGGTMGVNHIGTGASVVVHPGFDGRETLRAIAEDGITNIFMVPTQFEMVLEALRELGGPGAIDAPALRVLITAGAPMSAGLKARIAEAFPAAGLYEFYSATEAPMMTILRPEEQRTKPGSVGQPRGTSILSIRDEEGNELPPGEIGQIWASNPMVHLGYHERPEANAETMRDGFVTVGDLGRLDEDGYLYLAGRKADMIISGGFNVYPLEVEAVLLEHPAIEAAAVYGVADERWGEKVCASCVLAPGGELTADELAGWCRRSLSGYKVPRRIEFIDELPIAEGKVLRRELARRVEEAERAQLSS